jgi:hypothetical protein
MDSVEAICTSGHFANYHCTMTCKETEGWISMLEALQMNVETIIQLHAMRLNQHKEILVDSYVWE